MTETTSRLTLPLLASGQAQKEIWHNEALMLLDGLVQPVVQAVAPASVPSSPALGQCWIVGLAPSGDWAGHAKALACWTAGGWRFVAPFEGMQGWSIADGVPVRFEGGSWVIGQVVVSAVRIGGNQVLGARQGAISDPTGGTVIDVESRLALLAILGALRTHGLISP